jgi:hypothetical protein
MYVCLFTVITQSSQNGAVCWTSYQGLCMRPQCRRHVRSDGGIFCANYFATRGNFLPREGCWCGPCYTPLGVRIFPIRQKVDEDGELFIEEDEDERFKVAMVSFQCEMCHFRNILMRDPNRRNANDLEILDMMRRANLDAFWSRESTTVASNL